MRKRGWYVLRRLYDGKTEIFSGSFTTKKLASEDFSQLRAPYGTNVEYLAAAEVNDLGDKLIDRRKEYE